MAEKDNMLSGMLLGGLIGVSLGILFSPMVGEGTRKKIKDKLEEFKFDDLINRFSDAFEAGKEEADKVMNEETKE